MKKVFKILIFCFVLLFFFLIDKVEANSLNSVNMDVYIDKSGNAHVTEIWDYTVNSGTENYHSFKNIGNSSFSNFSVKDETKNYTTLSTWDINASFNSKAYKCGINIVTDGVELCWGISSYGRHTYTLTYTITNFVSQLNDCQMVYWELIPSGNTKGNVYIKIHSDFNYDFETPVWGYGNYGGTCYVYDGYIEMQSDGKLDSDEYMTILVKFPLETFNLSNKLNENFDYYYNMAEKGATHYSSNSNNTSSAMFALIPLLFFIVLMPFAIIALSANKSTLDFGKTGNKVPNDIPLYRDIPCNGDILRAYFIAYNYNLMKKKTDFLGAILLKWLKEGKIKIEKEETGKLFKKDDTCIIFDNNTSFENNLEQKIYKMFLEASKDGILQKKEFEKWCSNHYSEILDWFDSVIKYQKEVFINMGKIRACEITKFKIFKSTRYVVDSSLMEEAKELKGLKKYLNDFTLINKREAIEVTLFEEYLIFAQILGIAKQVASQFKKLYPEIIENYNYDYNDILFIYAISNAGITSANSAKSRAESYSSGGRRFFFWWWPEEDPLVAVAGMGSR